MLTGVISHQEKTLNTGSPQGAFGYVYYFYFGDIRR